MRNLLSLILITLFTISCSETEETGFVGEWEGEIEATNSDGEAILSATTALITAKDGLFRECQISVRSLILTYIAEKNENFIIYNKAAAINASDTTNQTFITGTTELVGDTLLRFDHEVIIMKGSSVISSDDFEFEMKRK